MKQENKYPLDNPAKSSPQDRKKSPERVLKEKKEKKSRRSKRLGTVITVLQGIVTAAFLAMLFVIDVLPFKYVGIVLLLLLLSFVFTWKTQGYKGIHIVGKLFGVLWSIVLAVGVYGLVITNMAFDSIIDKPSEKVENQVIADSVFCIYINDGEEGKVMVVNMETHQILEVTTPDKFYVTIPGVSNGQKDTLENAKQYGEEAVLAALGALYETKIPYYANINMGDLQRFLERFTPEMTIQPEILVQKIDDGVGTNLTKGQLRQLMKLYIREDVTWEIYPVSAEGFSSSHKTYTNPNEEELVLEPNKESVAYIIKLMMSVEDGEKLDVSDLTVK